MTGRFGIPGLAAGLLALALLVGPAFGQAAPDDDMKGMVKDLLETIRLQQQSINDLKQRMDSNDKQLSELRDLIKAQSEQFRAAQQSLEETRREVVASGPAVSPDGYLSTDEYAAKLQFDNAYSVQRRAIFDENIKRRDQPPYFRQAIKEFTLVVDRYPKTRWADESLVRVARLHKKLDEKEQARAAYQRLLDEYPQSKHATEAQEEIADLGR